MTTGTGGSESHSHQGGSSYSPSHRSRRHHLGRNAGLPIPNIINNLRRVLQERDVSQRELARMIGRERAHVCKLVNSKCPNPTLRTVILIAAALDCTVDDLFRLEDAP